MSLTPSTGGLPPVPTTTPKWLVHLVSLVLLVAGPVLAYTDPSGHISSAAAQAAVIIVFILVATIIFVVNLVIEGAHKYGWDMQMVHWVFAQGAQQIDADIQEFKTLWPQAKPAIEALPGTQAAIDSVTSEVNKLKQAGTSGGIDPLAVVSAMEVATGMTFPRTTPAATPPVTGTTTAVPPVNT